MKRTPGSVHQSTTQHGIVHGVHATRYRFGVGGDDRWILMVEIAMRQIQILPMRA